MEFKKRQTPAYLVIGLVAIWAQCTLACARWEFSYCFSLLAFY